MERGGSLQRQLRERNGVSVQRDWCEACVQWLLEEEGPSVPEERLFQLAYEQWLHSDLREVTFEPSLPALPGESGVVNGNYIVQISSIIDVGRAAYAQLQKIKGQSIDGVESGDKRVLESKPTRLLLLALSDGFTELQAMEYTPVPQLRLDTPPGTKLLLQGGIPHRLGMLLLGGDNVRVLGGKVEQLANQNSTQYVLSRILNLPEPALPLTEATPAQPHPPNTGSHSQAVTPSQSHPHSQPHPHITPTQSHITPTQSYSHNQQQAASLNTSQRPAYNSQNNFTFDEDFNNFETLNEVELLDSQEWPDEAIQSAGGSQNEWIGETVQYDAQNEFVSDELSDECLFGFHDNGLSGSTTWGKKPQVAPVRPMPRERQTVKQPLELKSFDKVSTSLWEAHSSVKIHAHFVSVCERISASDRVWATVVTVADKTGCKLTVKISNKILEEMIGFSAVEFNEHIMPHRNDPTVKARAGEGFARCQSAIAQLNCVMIIAKPSVTTEHPLLLKLLNH